MRAGAPSPSSSFLVNHLIYADDLVCIAENANDLQSLINIVNLWCCKHRLEANLLKTEIMHVRQPRSEIKIQLQVWPEENQLLPLL